jgi:hypothetical protein
MSGEVCLPLPEQYICVYLQGLLLLAETDHTPCLSSFCTERLCVCAEKSCMLIIFGSLASDRRGLKQVAGTRHLRSTDSELIAQV